MKDKNALIPEPYTLLDFHRETHDNFTITVDMKSNHNPGQFVQVSLPGIGEAPISICSDSREHIRLNIRQVGNMTNALAGLKKGDAVFLRGPYGHGYPLHELKSNNLIIIGGGCGVAPLKGIIEYVDNHRDDYKDVSLFLGYRSPDDILFSKDLEAWKKNFHVNLSVDTNADHKFCYDAKVGFVTESLKTSDLNKEGTVVFICGPPVMMKFVIGILEDKGFNDDQIFISAERLMYCGVGVCCHCMIRDKFTCKDGPVFRYDMIRDYKND